MLSLQFIRENPDAVRNAAAAKNVALDLDRLLKLDQGLRSIKSALDSLRATRNSISASFKDASPDQREQLSADAKDASFKIKELETGLAQAQAELDALLLRIPNIPWEGAPVGPDESFNTVVRREGAQP